MALREESLILDPAHAALDYKGLPTVSAWISSHPKCSYMDMVVTSWQSRHQTVHNLCAYRRCDSQLLVLVESWSISKNQKLAITTSVCTQVVHNLKSRSPSLLAASTLPTKSASHRLGMLYQAGKWSQNSKGTNRTTCHFGTTCQTCLVLTWFAAPWSVFQTGAALHVKENCSAGLVLIGEVVATYRAVKKAVEGCSANHYVCTAHANKCAPV